MGLTLHVSASLALSQLFFMGLFFIVYHRRHVLGCLLALFSVCLMAHILSLLPEVQNEAALVYVFRRLATATPAVLWVIARYLFMDNPRVHPLSWTLMAAYLAARAIGGLVYEPGMPAGDLLFPLCFILPQLIMLGFSMHAIYMAMQGMNDDLVESRRRVRVPFVVAMGTIIVVILGNGFFSSLDPYLSAFPIFQLPGVPARLLILYLFLVTLVFNLAILRLQNEVMNLLTPPSGRKPLLRPVPVTPRTSNDPALIERIHTLFAKERLYARPGLTIGDLAQRLSIPEYRLRRVINKQMDYRNFNQFLSKFRLEEACRRLEDSRELRESIASIAFDVGYSALSSFNKAFKEVHKVTPTQYREAAAERAAVLSSTRS